MLHQRAFTTSTTGASKSSSISPPDPLPEAIPPRDDWYGKPAGSSIPAMRPPVQTDVDLKAMRNSHNKEITQLTEFKQATKFLQQLQNQSCQPHPSPSSSSPSSLADIGMSASELRTVITSGMLTFLLHVESRTASALGQGFYTIGPCGEELLACIGLLLKETDAMALHYRHLAAQIARQLRIGRSIDDIALDRARGHVVSLLDPISAGGHCLIGKFDACNLVCGALGWLSCYCHLHAFYCCCIFILFYCVLFVFVLFCLCICLLFSIALTNNQLEIVICSR
jgi:hypothetical protein